MKGSDFKVIRELLKMSQKEIASLFGCKTYQIILLWEKDKATIPSLVSRIMLTLGAMREEEREAFINNLTGITNENFR